jgi:uncharacterized SAM-binding protein YcdF (DUF218 family)
MNGLRRKSGLLLLAAIVLFGVWSMIVSEVAYWRASRGAGAIGASDNTVVVVLGVPGEGFAGRAVQRWRVGLALKAWRSCRCNKVIFTGGKTRSKDSEASQMAALAIRRGMDRAVVVLDEKSRNTRENVVEAQRLAKGMHTVILVSDALHASRARRYWNQQNENLAQRIVLVDRYSFLDHFWLRTPATLVEFLHRTRN